MPVQPSTPVHASFPSSHLTIGAGVAIFHLASARVVVCYHSREKYWFLPKGRRNANEDVIRAAEREGFEESGYRNRVLPLPMKHHQPDPEEGPHEVFVAEPVWTQFLPLSATTQYLLFWYVAETLPRDLEAPSGKGRTYQQPSRFPTGMQLAQRIALDMADDGGGIYEPVRHENTGVDEDELLYESFLLPIADARAKVKGSVMEDVIVRGWEAIQLRQSMENEQTSV